MTRSIQAVIAPGPTVTRVLITESHEITRLKALLPPHAAHPRALPFLLEAIALWEGVKVDAAIAVDEWDATSATSLYHDAFHDRGSALYALAFVPVARARRARPCYPDALRMGDFRALRNLTRGARP